MLAAVGLGAGRRVEGAAIDVELISRAEPTLHSDLAGGELQSGSISADGRFVVFSSRAGNLVAGQVDENNANDVFLFDRATGSTTLVSHVPGAPTSSGDHVSDSPRISADGVYVAFESVATNLIGAVSDPGLDRQVYLFDRTSGSVRLVSHAAGAPAAPGDGTSTSPSLSVDGRWIAFQSRSTDLISQQVEMNGVDFDVFLFDRQSAEITLVSHAIGRSTATGNEESTRPVTSSDGRFVAFVSGASDLVSHQLDTNESSDVFLFDRVGGITTLVSHVPGSPTRSGNSFSFRPAISADGARVAFASDATDLVSGLVDQNDMRDVFLYSRSDGGVVLVSHVPGDTAMTADGDSQSGLEISRDGSWIAFASTAGNLVAGQVDLNGQLDVFLYDVATQQLTLVSHAEGLPESTGDRASLAPSLDGTGSRVAFRSAARDLVPGQSGSVFGDEVYVFERGSNEISLASHAPGMPVQVGSGTSYSASLSQNGEWIAYDNTSTDLVAGVSDFDELLDSFLYEVASGTNSAVTFRAPDSPSLTPGSGSSLAVESASSDGRFVLFSSRAVNLVPGQVDLTDTPDLFLADREAGTTTLVSRVMGSVATSATAQEGSAVLSSDGMWIAFVSWSSELIPGFVGPDWDVFLYERATGVVTLVSHLPGEPMTPGNGGSGTPSISADGSWVAFASEATDLVSGQVDENEGPDVFLFERATGMVRLVSHSDSGSGTSADSPSRTPRISHDGSRVVFESDATNLVAGQVDLNEAPDLFVYDRDSNELQLVSHDNTSSSATADGASSSAVISADGDWIAFESVASNLIPGQKSDSLENIFLYERSTEEVLLVSHAADSMVRTANGASAEPAISDDGAWVAFSSYATDLVDGQLGFYRGVFLYDRSLGSSRIVSHRLDSLTSLANADSRAPSINGSGERVAILSSATDMVSGQPPRFGNGEDVFLFERSGNGLVLVSHASGRPTIPGNETSAAASISADGRVVAFESLADNLVGGDDNTFRDIFVGVAAEDSVAPSDPSELFSTSHQENGWSGNPIVRMRWSGAADDPAGWGLRGYSVLFDRIPASEPDEVIDVAHRFDPHRVESVRLEDGDVYFHLSTCDLAGNCTSTIHAGPYRIDSSQPTTPGNLTSPSHTLGAPSSDRTVEVEWSASTDGGSGMAGYSWRFGEGGTGACDETVEGSQTATVSAALSDGSWWFSVCAVDAVGNRSATARVGPFVIDGTSPGLLSMDTVADTGDGVLLDLEATGASVTRIIARFDEILNEESVEDSASWLLVEAGSDGTIESTGCTVAPSDVEVGIDGATLEADAKTAVVELGGGRAIVRGVYAFLTCGGITDLAGNSHEGTRTRFVVTETNLLENPNLDTRFEPWIAGGTRPEVLAFSDVDAENKSSSGSMAVEITMGAGETISASQCVDLDPGLPSRVTGVVDIADGSGSDPSVRLEVVPSSSVACGTPGEPLSVVVASGVTEGWWPFRETIPLGALSAEVRLLVAGGGSSTYTVRFDLLGTGQGDPIFADGFESGDSSRWSFSLP